MQRIERFVPHGVSVIRDRYIRYKTLMIATLGIEDTKDKLLIDEIKNKPTTAARSEILAKPEDVIVLKTKITRARECVFERGSDKSEDYDLPRDTTYEDNNDLIEVSASRVRNENTHALIIGYKDGDIGVVVQIGFNNDFSLNINYVDNSTSPSRIDVEYNSSWQPMVGMTDEEYQIINSYLDNYIGSENPNQEAQS